MNEQHILIVGNIIDGLRFVGPFATLKDAEEAGVREDKGTWTTAPLALPPNLHGMQLYHHEGWRYAPAPRSTP